MKYILTLLLFLTTLQAEFITHTIVVDPDGEKTVTKEIDLPELISKHVDIRNQQKSIQIKGIQLNIVIGPSKTWELVKIVPPDGWKGENPYLFEFTGKHEVAIEWVNGKPVKVIVPLSFNSKFTLKFKRIKQNGGNESSSKSKTGSGSGGKTIEEFKNIDLFVIGVMKDFFIWPRIHLTLSSTEKLDLFSFYLGKNNVAKLYESDWKVDNIQYPPSDDINSVIY